MMSRELRLQKLRQKAMDSGDLTNYRKKLMEDIQGLAESVYNSNAIEGNTLSEDETYSLLKVCNETYESLVNEIRRLKENHEVREIEAIADLRNAIKFMYQYIDEPYLSEEFILELHAQATSSDTTISPGMYKVSPNFVNHNGVTKVFSDPSTVEEEIEEMIEAYNLSEKTLRDIAIMKGRFIHIHPFTDGNGRVSRILLNWALLSTNYVPITIKVDLRTEYIKALDDWTRYGDEDPESLYNLIMDYLEDAYVEILSK